MTRVDIVGVMKEPGRLIATGRDSEIFEHGPGLVLRRARNARSLASEARTMEYVRARGYPVPAVHELSADTTELVMERLDGPSMLAALSRRPWRLYRNADMLADLHRRLHEIEAPDWVDAAPVGEGRSLVHLDLHPLNIILTAHGPVVIDWPNAARGDGAVDVALTWILMAAGRIDGSRIKAALLGQGRALLINRFLAAFDRDVVGRLVPALVEWKAADVNMDHEEVRAMRALSRKVGGRG